MAVPHHRWMVLLLLLSAAHASEALSLPGARVLASEGSAASLPCLDGGHGGRRVGFRKLALRWTRERVAVGAGQPEGRYPLLMLGSDGVVKRGLSKQSQRARVSGERVNAGDYSLTLWGLRPGDAGTYHCLVQHGDARLKESVKLYVVHVRLESAGYPMEGGELGLLCEISRPLRGAQTSWHRAGNPVPAGGRFRTEEGGRRLRIARLEPGDQGDWECRVTFEMQSISASHRLQIFGFLESKWEVPTVYARPGADAHLSLALAPGPAREPLRWGWLRGQGAGSQPAESGGHPRVRAARNPDCLTLSLAPALPSDRGLFTGYINASGSWIERTVRLEFVEVTASQAGPVLIGSSLRVNISTGYPAGVDAVEWRHENDSLELEGEKFPEEGGGLYIPHVTLAHAGNWTCALYWHGKLVGNTSYLLEVTALGYQAAEFAPPSRRITLAIVFTLLLLFIMGAVFILLRSVKCRRRNFPALDVTLTTSEAPAKKL